MLKSAFALGRSRRARPLPRPRVRVAHTTCAPRPGGARGPPPGRLRLRLRAHDVPPAVVHQRPLPGAGRRCPHQLVDLRERRHGQGTDARVRAHPDRWLLQHWSGRRLRQRSRRAPSTPSPPGCRCRPGPSSGSMSRTSELNCAYVGPELAQGDVIMFSILFDPDLDSIRPGTGLASRCPGVGLRSLGARRRHRRLRRHHPGRLPPVGPQPGDLPAGRDDGQAEARRRSARSGPSP